MSPHFESGHPITLLGRRALLRQVRCYLDFFRFCIFFLKICFGGVSAAFFRTQKQGKPPRKYPSYTLHEEKRREQTKFSLNFPKKGCSARAHTHTHTPTYKHICVHMRAHMGHLGKHRCMASWALGPHSDSVRQRRLYDFRGRELRRDE